MELLCLSSPQRIAMLTYQGHLHHPSNQQACAVALVHDTAPIPPIPGWPIGSSEVASYISRLSIEKHTRS